MFFFYLWFGLFRYSDPQLHFSSALVCVHAEFGKTGKSLIGLFSAIIQRKKKKLEKSSTIFYFILLNNVEVCEKPEHYGSFLLLLMFFSRTK